MEKRKMVEVVSIGRGMVGYTAEGTGARRKWYKSGVSKQIPMEELIMLMNSQGGEVLLTRYLLIKDNEVRRILGLPLDKEKIMDKTDMIDVLNGSIEDLKETVKKMYPESVEVLADLAIELEIDHMGKINFLKEKTGIDVYRQIQEKKEENKGRQKE